MMVNNEMTVTKDQRQQDLIRSDELITSIEDQTTQHTHHSITEAINRIDTMEIFVGISTFATIDNSKDYI